MYNRRKFLLSSLAASIGISLPLAGRQTESGPRRTRSYSGPAIISTWHHGLAANAAAWEKLGATPEEIEQLCDIAMEGDRGMAEQFPAFEFSLGKTIAGGHAVCEIRFDKK